MDPLKVLQHLKDDPNLRLVEAHHVSTFTGTRETRRGKTQQFTVTILDAGPRLRSHARYICRVETDDGLRLQGDPYPTLSGALSILDGLRTADLAR